MLADGIRINLCLGPTNLFYIKLSQVEQRMGAEMLLASLEKKAMVKMSAQDLLQMHGVLGHISNARVLKWFNQVCVEEQLPCSVCLKTTTTKQPYNYFNSTSHMGTYPGHITCVDFTGPFRVPGLGGEVYMFVTLDDFSGVGLSYPRQDRSAVDKPMLLHIQRAAVYPATTPVIIGPGSIIQSDNEMLTKAMEALCASKAMHQQSSPPGQPQQNPRIERHISIISNMTACMMQHSQAQPRLWSLAWRHAQYVAARVPIAAPQAELPIELYTGTVMSAEVKKMISNLPMFGATTYVHTGAKFKLEPKAQAGIFVGFNINNNSCIRTRSRLWKQHIFELNH